jgi:hypothetical protein
LNSQTKNWIRELGILMSKDRRRSNYGPFLTYYCGINLKAEEKP